MTFLTEIIIEWSELHLRTIITCYHRNPMLEEEDEGEFGLEIVHDAA